jgi:hypothetical protein
VPVDLGDMVRRHQTGPTPRPFGLLRC